MGKERKKYPKGFGEWRDGYANGVEAAMKMIDQKIEKINKL